MVARNSRRDAGLLGLLCAVIIPVVGLGEGPAPSKKVESAPTYSGEVAAILQKRC